MIKTFITSWFKSDFKVVGKKLVYVEYVEYYNRRVKRVRCTAPCTTLYELFYNKEGLNSTPQSQ